VKPLCLSAVSLDRPDTDVRCHACGGSRLRRIFSIPLCDGPHQSDKDVKRRTIYQCNSCSHYSADGYDRGRYAQYYASLSGDYHLSHDDDQSRYQQIFASLPKQPLKRVLDIGCGTGTFLAMFSPDVQRFGIEPSSSAADRARGKGIEIIDYKALNRPELRNSFDLVTAIDVVEHMADLQEFRRHVATALRPGGLVIILTGDAQSWAAKLLGRYWLYLNYTEHITFFCARSMRTWLQPNFSEIELTTTNHEPWNKSLALSLIRVWLLFPVKWLLQQLSPVRLNIYAALSLPRDHMLVRAVRNQTLADQH
jgi:2-polyprenyl-3-methyl-5-hydroxy-6-metoxy-1,4-benzoquinol methylase